MAAPLVEKIAAAGAVAAAASVGEEAVGALRREALAFFDADHATPSLLWNEACRDEVRAMLQEELAPVLEFIAAGARPSLCSWDGSTLAERFERRVWAEELKVGAIYVRHFIGCDGLGHRWKAGDDVAFLAALWQALASEGSFCTDCARALAAAPDEAAKGLGAEAAHAAENLRLLLEALALLLPSPPLRAAPPSIGAQPWLFSFAMPLERTSTRAAPRSRVMCSVPEFAAAVGRTPSRSSRCRGGRKGAEVVRRSLGRLAPGALACGLLGVAVSSPPLAGSVLQLTHAGGLLLLLDLLLGGGGEEVRVSAARALNAMVADSVHGAEVAHTCVALLTPAFASRFEAKPEALAAFVSKAHKCSGGREWSDATRRGLGVHVSELVGRLLDEPPAADDGAAAARWA